MAGAAVAGQGYPDGGKVASYFGGALVNENISLAPGNAWSSPIVYVGAFSGLTVRASASLNQGPYAVTLQWFADELGNVSLGQISYRGEANVNVLDSLPNVGPYVQMTLENIAPANTFFIFGILFPRQGQQMLGGANIFNTSLIPASSIQQFKLPTIRTGSAVLCVPPLVNGTNVQIYYEDTFGVQHFLYYSGNSGTTATTVQTISLPPGQVIVVCQNALTTAAQVGFHLTVLPS